MDHCDDPEKDCHANAGPDHTPTRRRSRDGVRRSDSPLTVATLTPPADYGSRIVHASVRLSRTTDLRTVRDIATGLKVLIRRSIGTLPLRSTNADALGRQADDRGQFAGSDPARMKNGQSITRSAFTMPYAAPSSGVSAVRSGLFRGVCKPRA
jgi:hypothetical protein